jgi:hypothetical protein
LRFFGCRYFGRRSTPWQERAAYEILEAVGGDDREFVVMNEPPGAGKHSCSRMTFRVGLIARDRTIRIQLVQPY